ncbi:MAG: hypothetical protein WAV32_08210 [Halobacteriota archaeon]
MEGNTESMLEKVWKEAEKLTLKEQLELVEKIDHELREREMAKKYLDWSELYGLGKGLWEGDDAQEYVNRLRADRNDLI